MNKFYLVSRILLGLLFAVFGLNGFLNFIPMPPPHGLAGQYLGALFASGLSVPLFALQLIAGLLLLVNRFVPLALALLAPIVVNIVLYHLLMDPKSIGGAILAVALWASVFYRERAAFAGLWRQRSAS